jgi:hypothetical protein
MVLQAGFPTTDPRMLPSFGSLFLFSLRSTVVGPIPQAGSALLRGRRALEFPDLAGAGRLGVAAGQLPL